MNACLKIPLETPPIQFIGKTYDVRPILDALEAHPEFWDKFTLRTERYNTPHKHISDIWFRFNDWANSRDPWAFTMFPHESVWYEAADAMPAVKELVRQVMRDVGGNCLGGVLMTRIPPGGEVLPHQDGGWHAGFYEKFAVQIKGNKDQAFHFESCELRPEAGEAYTFNNSHIHWVTNDSSEERITLIICIRRDDEKPLAA